MTLDLRQYYHSVFPQLEKGFQFCHYVLGYGNNLIDYGWDPKGLLVTVEPVENLFELTVNKELEVFIPVVGHDSNSVLLPFDFEVAIASPWRLYSSMEGQQWFFQNNIAPVAHYLSIELESRQIPHVLDFTPSGGHFLTRVVRGTAAWEEVAAIGYLDDIALAGYDIEDPSDLKRCPRIKQDAAYVFSGLGFLSEYLALRTLQTVSGHTDLPMTLWDTKPDCMNIDLSWTGDPAYMRIMRAPFSAHKKRNERFGIGNHSLVDVMGRYYDGVDKIEAADLDDVVECMWDLQKANRHAKRFPGYIPFANEGMCALVADYLNSPLKEFHDYCHFGEDNLAPGEALHRIFNDSRLSEQLLDVFHHPNPRLLNPGISSSIIAELRLNDWHPRHITNAFTDCYRNGDYWGMDYFKYSPELKAWAFSRQYSALTHAYFDGWRT
mgnify:CR=1 FL=1